MVDQSSERHRFWWRAFKPDDEVPENQLLLGLLADAGASFPTWGTASDLLENALASIRHQKSLFLAGKLKSAESVAFPRSRNARHRSGGKKLR
jgi:hypothetical protein